jgi:hypothetical protein
MQTFLCVLAIIAGPQATVPQASKPLPVPSDSATLIVTYQTGPYAERLDRVRFRLTGEDNAGTLFPLPGTYHDDALTHIRRVIIQGLRPGRYTLDFLIPNYDGLFAEVGKQEVKLDPKSLVQIDQEIKPRYTRVNATASFADSPPKKQRRQPFMTLYNEAGKALGRASGQLLSTELTPGHYTLVFEEETGYVTPEPIHFTVTPGAPIGPLRRVYTKANKTPE